MLLPALLLALQTTTPVPSQGKPLVGPPSPYKLSGAATVWVVESLLPELGPMGGRRPVTHLERFSDKLRANPVLPPKLSIDPLAFLPPLRYGGQPLPQVYTFGKGAEW